MFTSRKRRTSLIGRKKTLLLALSALLGLGGISFAVGASVSPNYQEMRADSVVYTCDFETTGGFTAGTTYNSTQNHTDISAGAKAANASGVAWEAYYGAWSTSSKINGSQSAALRAYKSAPSAHAYLMTETDILGVTSISYYAKAATSNSATLLLDVSYSTDQGANWTVVESAKELGNTNPSTPYTANFPNITAKDGVRVKFAIASSSTFPTSSSAQLTIDDVAFTVTSGPAIELTPSSITVPTNGTATIKANISGFGNAISSFTSDYVENDYYSLEIGDLVDGEATITLTGKSATTAAQTVTFTATDGTDTATADLSVEVGEVKPESVTWTATETPYFVAGHAFTASNLGAFSVGYTDGTTKSALSNVSVIATHSDGTVYSGINSFPKEGTYTVKLASAEDNAIASSEATFYVISANPTIAEASAFATNHIPSSSTNQLNGDITISGILSATGTQSTLMDPNDSTSTIVLYQRGGVSTTGFAKGNWVSVKGGLANYNTTMPEMVSFTMDSYKEPASLAITTVGTTEYDEGDVFDASGFAFALVYGSGDTAVSVPVTGVTNDKSAQLTTNDSVVTFSYTDSLSGKSFTATQTINVKVNPYTLVTAETEVAMNVGVDHTVQLTPSEAFITAGFEWDIKSSDATVATAAVDESYLLTISSLKAGSTTITAYIMDKTATYEATVEIAVTVNDAVLTLTPEAVAIDVKDDPVTVTATYEYFSGEPTLTIEPLETDYYSLAINGLAITVTPKAKTSAAQTVEVMGSYGDSQIAIAEFTIEVTDALQYTKVTSVADLTIGATYVIGHEDTLESGAIEVTFADKMGSNTYLPVSATKGTYNSLTGKASTTVEPALFTLAYGAESGQYSLWMNAEGTEADPAGYIGRTSNTGATGNNIVDLSETLAAEYSMEIACESGGTISITSPVTSTLDRHLRYNYNNGSNSRFTFYGTNYTNYDDICLYKAANADANWTAADNWAKTFLDETGTLCASEDGTVAQETNWSKWSTTYKALNQVQKDLIAKATASEKGDNIAQALLRYDFIVKAYGATNFMEGRTVSSALRFNGVPEESSTFITILAVMGGAVLTGGIYFAMKKRSSRKEEE